MFSLLLKKFIFKFYLASPQLSVVSHPENSGACLDLQPLFLKQRKVARPQVSAVSHPVNSGTCLDTTSSVSAVKQSSILFKNSKDLEVECACCSKKGKQTEFL